MDNASKAIIIAGGFLIAMLIISLSMYLLASFQSYYEGTSNALKLQSIQEYNSFFEAYPNNSIVSGDVAYSFCKKCEDIQADDDSEYTTSYSINITDTLDKVFFFTESFADKFKYSYDYNGATGVIESISFEKI